MKFVIPLILWSTAIVAFVEFNEAHDYGPLIEAIHGKYKTTGVIILTEMNYASFGHITIWHEVVRMLSDKGISTVIVNFRQFKDKLMIRNEITARSLNVIIINTIERLHAFQSFTKNLDMSYGVWLIFFAGDASRDVCEFCRNSNRISLNLKFDSKVLISCCKSNMIERWWNSGGNHTKKPELGRLVDDGKPRTVWFFNELTYGHHYSLKGQALRITAIKHSVVVQEKDGIPYGFFAVILGELSREMNFTISSIIWEDNHGVLNSETSNWTGVMGRIHRREADLGVSGLIMTSERSNIVSFTSPILIDTLQLHFRKYDVVHLAWSPHFKALTVDVWMVIIGLILTTPILLTLIRYKRRSHFFPLHFEHHLYVWGIYCQQGLPEFPNELPSRIVYVSILLSALVSSVAYSAAIISNLTTPSYPPFNTMEEFVRDGTYKLIMLNHTKSMDLYKFTDQTFTKKLMSLLKPDDDLPESAQKAFEQVCSERVAFYGSKLAKKSLHKLIPCEIMSIESGKIVNIAMIMSRDSEYIDLFNYYIARFRSNGILQRMEREYFSDPQSDEYHLPPVNLQGITPILVILAVGFLIATIIFIMERTFHPFTKNSEISIYPRNHRIRHHAMRKKSRALQFSIHKYASRKFWRNRIQSVRKLK